MRPVSDATITFQARPFCSPCITSRPSAFVIVAIAALRLLASVASMRRRLVSILTNGGRFTASGASRVHARVSSHAITSVAAHRSGREPSYRGAGAADVAWNASIVVVNIQVKVAIIAVSYLTV